MSQVQLGLMDNNLAAERFIRLKAAAGFMDRPLAQAGQVLKMG